MEIDCIHDFTAMQMYSILLKYKVKHGQNDKFTLYISYHKKNWKKYNFEQTSVEQHELKAQI